MKNIEKKELEITEWDIRRIPEMMQIPVTDFVIGYHETKKKYDESITDEDKDFYARELQWLELLIDIRYKDSNLEYKSKLPNVPNILKNEALNPLILLILKSTRKYKINIINKDKLPKKRGTLFISNHVSFQDIQILKEVVRTPATILVSNDSPGMTEQQKKLLKLIGAYLFDRRNPKERYAAKEFLTTELAQGRNGILFPESIHNRTDSTPILPMHWGFVDMAKDSKTIITPTALDMRNGDYTINIGDPFIVYPKDHPQEVYEHVRDSLATLRWEIWESFPQNTRDEILQIGLELDNSLPWDSNHETQFMFKPYNTPEEVFEPIKIKK